PRREEQPLRALDDGAWHAPALNLVCCFAGEHGRALHRDALREEYGVSRLPAAGAYHPRPLHVAEHTADDNRLRQPGGHLGVAADERHADAVAGVDQLVEEPLDLRR